MKILRHDLEKTEYKRRSFRVITIVLVCVAIVILSSLSFTEFINDNQKSINERNEAYIQDFTLSLAKKLNEKFYVAQTSVCAVADMIEGNLAVNPNLEETLTMLEEETEFDHVRYVDADGISHTSGGTTADVSDRVYFKEGIKGHTGSTYITDSRLTNQRQVGFYAPIKTDDGIKGVIVAFFDEATLEKSLEYYFYGEKSSVAIITTDGKMVINSPSDTLQKLYDEGLSEDVCELVNTDYVDEANREIIEKAYTNRTETPFEMQLGDENTIGYMAPLESVNLNVYMTFPYKANEALYESSVAAGRKLQTRLLLIFGVAALFMSFMGIGRIREEKNMSSLFKHRAISDELTGMLNRRAYEQEFESLSGKPLPENLVYVSMDINGLKSINDGCGHTAGDELIKAAAECMNQCIGPYGKIFRTGGDEFIAIISADADQLQTIKDSLKEATGRWVGKNGNRLNISCGYVNVQDVDPQTIKEMSRLADKRMYEAKAGFYAQKGVDRRYRAADRQ